jgi:hypothetical protein
MKKYIIIIALVSISSLAMPLVAVAVDVDRGTIDACNNQGKVYNNVTQECEYPSSVVGTSGGINIAVIKPYSDSIIGIINTILVPVLVAIAFIVFLWGVFKYLIYGGDNDTERATGKKLILWGIIAFVIIFSIWGIVNVLMGALNLSSGTHPSAPKI